MAGKGSGSRKRADYHRENPRERMRGIERRWQSLEKESALAESDRRRDAAFQAVEEEKRQISEEIRAGAELARGIAENGRSWDELDRQDAESLRALAEEARAAAETLRAAAQEQKDLNAEMRRTAQRFDLMMREYNQLMDAVKSSKKNSEEQ